MSFAVTEDFAEMSDVLSGSHGTSDASRRRDPKSDLRGLPQRSTVEVWADPRPCSDREASQLRRGRVGKCPSYLSGLVPSSGFGKSVVVLWEEKANSSEICSGQFFPRQCAYKRNLAFFC